MPTTTTADGVRISWLLDGDVSLPPLVLLHPIGATAALWEPLLVHIREVFRTLRIDLRGHGASDAPAGDYTLATLARDVAAVMTDAAIPRAAVAGASFGGMVAMQLAADAPPRVSAIALVCSSAAMDTAVWQVRIDAVRSSGMVAVADAAVQRFLSPAFYAANPAIVQALKDELVRQSATGYSGCGAAIRDMAIVDRLPSLNVPTLVVTTAEDASTPYAGHGDRLLAGLPDAVHVALPGGHFAPIEVPAKLGAALTRFLGGTAGAEATLFAAGLVNRRRALGDAFVDRALAARTDFNSDFQDLITRIAWHEIWGRPGLDPRTRRLLVVVITASLGRWDEFRIHVRAGLEQKGFTRVELKEALMQTAIYAGVPAANTAFAEAMKILADLTPAGTTA